MNTHPANTGDSATACYADVPPTCHDLSGESHRDGKESCVVERRFMHARFAWILLQAVIPLACAGCGKTTTLYPTTGRVAFSDGKPLTGGWIEMETAEVGQKSNPRGPIQADGSFELGTFQPGDGAMPGRYRVLVMPPSPDIDPDEMTEKRVLPAIHQRFTRYATSGLEFTVGSDEAMNVMNITVERPSR